MPKARELYGEVAEESMLNELTKLHRKNTMVPIDPRSLTRQQRRKVITSKMFLKEKFLSTGEFDKLKSRLVAGGHRQDRRQYAEWEITSPTVSMASVYMISAIAAMEQRRVMTIDVGNAYLNRVYAQTVNPHYVYGF